LKKKDLRARVTVATNFGQIRCGDPPIKKLGPVDLTEPGVGKDVTRAVFQVTITLTRLALHELHYEIRCVRVKGRPADVCGPADDVLVELDRVRRLLGLVIRRYAEKHFEDEHSEGVPVYGFVVSIFADDLWVCKICGVEMSWRNEAHLWCEIVWCPTQRPGHVRAVLCEPKVGDLDMPICVKQNVLRFEITVDDVERVEVI
jgi:hypothetical protein